MSEWLPPLCLLSDHGGAWTRYEDELYRYFRRDFIIDPPQINRIPIQVNVIPVVNGKEEAFWHLITEEQSVERNGLVTLERLPQISRCERIRWPGAILREGPSERVRVWKERRPDGLRLIYALADFSYLVALSIRRQGKLFLATSFPVEERGKRIRLSKQYERFVREGEP
jgi:hypothetical protein